MVSPLEANAAALLAVLVLGVSALLAGVSTLSWRRLGHPKLLLVALAFAVLAVQGARALWAAVQGAPPDLLGAGLDLGVVLLLYASVVQR